MFNALGWKNRGQNYAGTPDQTSTNVQYPTHNNTGVSAEELGMVEADS